MPTKMINLVLDIANCTYTKERIAEEIENKALVPFMQFEPS